jgi:hypothetical protein
VCIGTPDDAIAYIDRLMSGSGGFGVICELAHNWADWDATKKHYELMARFVHPHFQTSTQRVATRNLRDRPAQRSKRRSTATPLDVPVSRSGPRPNSLSLRPRE